MFYTLKGNQDFGRVKVDSLQSAWLSKWGQDAEIL